MTKTYKWLCAISTGLFLVLAWYPMPLLRLIFLAWVPLLYLQHTMHVNQERGFFKYAIVSLLIWNIGVTWWVYYSTAVGSLAAFILNSLLMYLPWHFYIKIKKKLSAFYACLFLVCAIVIFEKLHLTWELSWPWLTLGNVFASSPNTIQWYEITGHLGGSIWVLLVNVLIFQIVLHFQNKKLLKKFAIASILTLILPVVVSIVLLKYRNDCITQGEGKDCIVVQPNIDPYDEKFNANSLMWQMQHLRQLSDSLINPSTEYIFWPETAIPMPTWLNHFYEYKHTKYVQGWVDSIAPVQLISGITLLEEYPDSNHTSATARYNGEVYFDVYNSALAWEADSNYNYYHKSKLVPGVERMPYPSVFKFLAPLAIDMGGMIGSHGTQKERSVLGNKQHPIAPVICYESVYGSYCTDYFKNGAKAMAIVTNDGWWQNSPGHKQHLQYARLRAIENRKWIARSANTGISCFIDPLGNLHNTTNYNEVAVSQQKIYFNNISTLYTQFGDWVVWLCFIALLLLLTLYFLQPKNSLRT